MTRILLIVIAASVAAVWIMWSDPCGSPITYRLGDLDERFHLPADQALDILLEAEAIWEKPTGIDLFRHEDDGRMPIHFLYDARQMTAQENARRKETIEDTSESADEVRRKYESASKRYEAAKKDFLKVKASHEARVDAYNRKVAAWNQKGGTSAQFDDLRREEASIAKEARVLEEGRLAANDLAEKSNRLSERYNELAASVNAEIDAINTTAGREFKQARYVADLTGRRIEIFEYRSREDLVHVLAHELGHAIGLPHNENRGSIMYGLNSTQSDELAAEDLASLRQKCRL